MESSYLSTLPKDVLRETILFLPIDQIGNICQNLGVCDSKFWEKRASLELNYPINPQFLQFYDSWEPEEEISYHRYLRAVAYGNLFNLDSINLIANQRQVAFGAAINLDLELLAQLDIYPDDLYLFLMKFINFPRIKFPDLDNRQRELLSIILQKYEDHTLPEYPIRRLWISAIFTSLGFRNQISTLGLLMGKILRTQVANFEVKKYQSQEQFWLLMAALLAPRKDYVAVISQQADNQIVEVAYLYLSILTGQKAEIERLIRNIGFNRYLRGKELTWVLIWRDSPEIYGLIFRYYNLTSLLSDEIIVSGSNLFNYLFLTLPPGDALYALPYRYDFRGVVQVYPRVDKLLFAKYMPQCAEFERLTKGEVQNLY